MENIILSPISLDNLELLIRKSVLSALSSTQSQAKPTEEEQRFNPRELGVYLNRTPQTITAYKKRGIFKYYQTGRTIYFKKSEVDAALASDKKGFKHAA
jgi:hypothetical protein